MCFQIPGRFLGMAAQRGSNLGEALYFEAVYEHCEVASASAWGSGTWATSLSTLNRAAGSL